MKALIIALLLVLFASSARSEWARVESGTDQGLSTIQFKGTRGYIVGPSTVLRSVDEGTSWQSIAPSVVPAGIQFRAVCFINDATGYLAASQFIYKTQDGGMSWNIIKEYPNSYYSGYTTINGVIEDETSEGVYVIVAQRDGVYSEVSRIAHFTDNISKEITVPNNRVVTHIAKTGENYTLIARPQISPQPGGSGTTYLGTMQSGMSLTFQDLPNGMTIPLLDAASGYYFDHTWHYYSYSGGSNSNRLALRNLNPTMHRNIEDCFYYHRTAYTVIGHWGGGQHVPETTYAVYYQPNAMTKHGDNLYFVGQYLPDRDNKESASIKRYDLRTRRIIHERFSGKESINSIATLNGSLFACGEDGIILKKQSDSEKGQGLLSPNDSKSYTLAQNYPNPFNPTTQITFSIPLQSQARISIYDIAGREVMEILNEVKSSGSHSVTFDGSKLASGTYFYKLEAGEYREVKKMLLIK